MTQASNLAKAINKLMESKLDSSLREKYFVVNPFHTQNISGVENLTTLENDRNHTILIGPDDIIRIGYPGKEYEDTSNGDWFRGTVSEAIEQGYAKGNFIFSFKPQDTQVETGQG